MQAAKFTFVQTGPSGRPSMSDWSADFTFCPGHLGGIWANYRLMPLQKSAIVLDKAKSCQFAGSINERSKPLRAGVLDAVARGTSGAESTLNMCTVAAVPPHRRAPRGASTGFLAVQLRRVSFETSRALLLLPPSLVRSGTLRSDIYARHPALARRVASSSARRTGAAR